jgi:hypothetical protein
MPDKTYPPGSVKQDPESKAVAVKRDATDAMSWGVMTLANGGHYAADSEVAEWADLA